LALGDQDDKEVTVNVATSTFLSLSLPGGDHGERRQLRRRATDRAAGTTERVAAAVGGAALLHLAGRRRPLLGLGLALAGAPLIYRGLTGRWPVTRGLAALAAAPIEVEAGVTIDRPAADLYAFWRKLDNLPRFMHGLQSVTEDGDGHSHWVGHLHFGLHPQWDAEIVEDLPGRLLSWRSMPGAQVHNAGVVLFEDIAGTSAEAPAGRRGAVVRVIMEVMPFGAGFGRALGRALRAATEQQVREDLRRFKCLMEAGEVPTTEGQAVGGRAALDPHNPF
jgi:uncharacterized membrane protein